MGTTMEHRGRRLPLALLCWMCGAPAIVAQAATAGPFTPGTCVNDASIGSNAWMTPTAAQVSDDVTSGVGVTTAVPTSNYLKCTGFGFSIPAGSSIDGIRVEWEYRSSAGCTTNDNAVRIVKGGVIGSADRVTNTASVTQTPTDTPTSTATASNTATHTATQTATPTNTATASHTVTQTVTDTPTATQPGDGATGERSRRRLLGGQLPGARPRRRG